MTYSYLNKKGDKLSKAAEIYLKLGEFEHYCECLTLMNQWEKALAFAPRVSMSYWKQLSARYASYLQDETTEEAFPYLILSNQINKTIDYFLERGQLEDSFLVCAMNVRGRLTEKDPEEIEFSRDKAEENKSEKPDTKRVQRIL